MIGKRLLERILPKKFREINRMFREHVIAGYNAYKKVLSNEFVKTDTRIYFMDYAGSGDTYLCCSYLKQNNIISNEDMLVVPSSISGKIATYFDFGYILELPKDTTFNIRIFGRFYGKKIRVLPLLYESVPLRYSGILRQMQGYKGIDFMSMLRIGMEINLKIISKSDTLGFNCLPYKQKEIDIVNERYNPCRLPIALLSPYAGNSHTENVPIELWEKLALYFKKSGYMVYTNSMDPKKEPIIKESKSICLPYHLVIPFITTRGGVFIGLRSGLCDIVSAAEGILKVILYADKCLPEGVGKWSDFFSLRNMKLCDDVLEFEIKNGKYQDVLEKIVNEYSTKFVATGEKSYESFRHSSE